MPATLRILTARFVSLLTRRSSSSIVVSTVPEVISENFIRVCSECLDFALEEVDSSIVSEEDIDLKWNFDSSNDKDEICSIIDLYFYSDEEEELSPSSPQSDTSSLWDDSASFDSSTPFSSPATSYSLDLEEECSLPVYNIPIVAPKAVNPALATPTWLEDDFDSIAPPRFENEHQVLDRFASSPSSFLPEHLENSILSLVSTPEPVDQPLFATFDRASLPAHLATLPPPRNTFVTFDRSSEVYTTLIVAPKPFNPSKALPSWLHDNFDATSESDSDSRASFPIPSNVHDTFDYFAPSPTLSSYSVDTPELDSDSCSDTTSGSFTCAGLDAPWTPLLTTEHTTTYEQSQIAYTHWNLEPRAPAPCYLDLLMDKYAPKPTSPLPSNVHDTFDYFSPSPASFVERDFC